MSAASFLGISALVYTGGFYGLIYSIGFLVGWPFIMFLMAEPLRNLGRFTFADVASYRLEATPIRALAAIGTLVTVSFYLIAQMVGAGQLIQLLFGLPYLWAVIIVGVLMIIYVTFGGMIATTWVQIIKAGLLLAGSTLIAILVLAQFGFDFNALIAKAIEVHASHDKILLPGAAVANPINAFSLGIALMFGTAGLPHILMRFFTVKDAKEARKSVFWATDLHRLFLHSDLHHRLRRDRAGVDQPRLSRRRRRQGGAARRRQHAGDPSRPRRRRRPDEGLHRRGRVRDDPRGGVRPDAVGRKRRQPRSLRERDPTRQDR